jgi:hypothetical protein
MERKLLYRFTPGDLVVGGPAVTIAPVRERLEALGFTRNESPFKQHARVDAHAAAVALQTLRDGYGLTLKQQRGSRPLNVNAHGLDACLTCRERWPFRELRRVERYDDAGGAVTWHSTCMDCGARFESGRLRDQCPSCAEEHEHEWEHIESRHGVRVRVVRCAKGGRLCYVC